MLYAASVDFPRQAAFVIKRLLIYSLSRCLIITVIWLPEPRLTRAPHACARICRPDARLTPGVSGTADAWESDVAGGWRPRTSGATSRQVRLSARGGNYGDDR